MNESQLNSLREVVPQTYGEAVKMYPFVADYPSHEWDNRTTLENAKWLIMMLTLGHWRARKS